MPSTRRFERAAFRLGSRVFLLATTLALVSLTALGQDDGALQNRAARSLAPGASSSKPYPASPGLSPIWRPSLPTGELASFRRFTRDAGAFQPVFWKLPKGVAVEVAQEGGYLAAPDDSKEFSLEVGAVYRFRLSGLDTAPGETLYPTVELIGRLYPPEGREWDFPVEIEIPRLDLEMALRGNFITRVIFVENAANPANIDASESNEPLTINAPNSIDPIVAAATRGRPLVILRLGSREPNGEPTVDDPFFFGLPRVEFRPELNPTPDELEPDESKTEAFEVKQDANDEHDASEESDVSESEE